ncbi:ABC transporter permease [Pseudonocardia nigra]|uniref:ABC transporter permease n=1 Tax=Pseudonocardia nigra TaxID=1921578 RepID=UPI001C5D8C2C|nr:ABC transporter permease subunit [Pseudonocardia nigra]
MIDLPVGVWVEAVVDFLRVNAAAVFDGLAALTLALVNAIYLALVLPHPLVVIAVLAGLTALATRRWLPPVLAAVGFLLILAMQMWEATLQSLAVVLLASVVAIAIGVPIGIAAARMDRVRTAIRPVLDFMQTLPVFVYLLPAVFFFGIGVVPGVVATTIFAIPPAVRLTELGIRQVDQEVVEAAVAFGSRPRQVLRDVQLPLAMPSIMAGVNQVIMLALSMVVIAGMVGGGGLGAVVVQAVTKLDIGQGFEGGLAVVIVAIYLDRVTAAFGARGIRIRRRRAPQRRSSPDAAGPAEQRQVAEVGAR